MLHLLSEATPLSLPFICELRWVSPPISRVLCAASIIYLTHFHYFRFDIMLVPLRNGNIWKYSLKKSNCVQ